MTERTVEQLALFMNARDNAESGTALWKDLDAIGRGAYLKEAAAIVGAMRMLGWVPTEPAVATADQADAVEFEEQLRLVTTSAEERADIRKSAILVATKCGLRSEQVEIVLSRGMTHFTAVCRELSRVKHWPPERIDDRIEQLMFADPTKPGVPSE